jgi:hypothetical protein
LLQEKYYLMHPACYRIVISVASFAVLGCSNALAQGAVSQERAGADTLAVNTGIAGNPWDSFYPVPPGAELVVPGTKPEGEASVTAIAGFTVQLSASKGCDTSCHKPRVQTAALKRKAKR